MNILFITRLYSGFEFSLKKSVWSPEGVPTIYKLLDKLSLENKLSIILTAKDSGSTYKSNWEETKDLEIKPGIVLHSIHSYDDEIETISDMFENIMILSIPEAGFSGQKFVEKSFDLIKKINQIQKRKKINLFVDGGINRENIKNMNVENIISGSDVLNNKNPREQIMRLKTFGRYI